MPAARRTVTGKAKAAINHFNGEVFKDFIEKMKRDQMIVKKA